MTTMTAPLSDTELLALAGAKVVDARGSACPGPLLEAKKQMGTVAIGELMEIWSSDPGTKADVSAWANKIGHTYLGTVAAEGYERTFVVRQK
jgi:tRNA 2-thiouridine synthesizing protein A